MNIVKALHRPQWEGPTENNVVQNNMNERDGSGDRMKGMRFIRMTMGAEDVGFWSSVLVVMMLDSPPNYSEGNLDICRPRAPAE